MILRFSVIAGLALVLGCSSTTTSPTPAPSSTSPTDPGDGVPAEQPPKLTAYTEGEVQALFDTKCVRCHDSRSANIDLSEPFTATTIDVRTGGTSGTTLCGKSSEFTVRIKSGDRERSLLWHKVQGTQDCGAPMPSDTNKGGKKLDATELERLGLYIDGLAKG